MELLHTEQIIHEWHLAGQVWHESTGRQSNDYHEGWRRKQRRRGSLQARQELSQAHQQQLRRGFVQGKREGRKDGGTDFQWLSRSRFWLTSFTLPDPPGSFSAILHCLLPSSSSSCFSLHLLLPPVVEDVLQPVVELTDHREWTRQCQRSVLSLSVGKGFLHPEGKPTSGQSKGSHSRPLEVIRLQLSLCKKKKNVVGLKGHSNKTELRAIR